MDTTYQLLSVIELNSIESILFQIDEGGCRQSIKALGQICLMVDATKGSESSPGSSADCPQL